MSTEEYKQLMDNSHTHDCATTFLYCLSFLYYLRYENGPIPVQKTISLLRNWELISNYSVCPHCCSY